MDINNHSTNEHVFGQRLGPAIKIDLLKNSERTNNKHKPKSKPKKNTIINLTKNLISDLRRKASLTLLNHLIASPLFEISPLKEHILENMVKIIALNKQSSMLI